MEAENASGRRKEINKATAMVDGDRMEKNMQQSENRRQKEEES